MARIRERPASPIPSASATAAGAAPLSWRGAAAPVLLALGFVLLVNLAIRHTELVTGRYIASGVPPIPVFAGLLLFLGARPLLHRIHPRLCPDRRQALLLYATLTIGVWVGGMFGVRAFLPHLVALPYWSRSQPALGRFVEYLPAWYAVHDAEAARIYYEGSPEGRIAWSVWLPLLLRWLPFFLALFGAAFCLMLLFRRQWLHAERLSFPLLALPLALVTKDGTPFAGGQRPLFRHPLMWLGFGAAAAFNGINIAHALVPAIPAPGFYHSLSGLFPDRPWTPLNSITLMYMLEVVGFGYFVPLEVTFSAWSLYLLERFIAVGGVAAGIDRPGFPFMQEQSAGAYFACGLLLVWGARRHMLGEWRAAWAPAAARGRGAARRLDDGTVWEKRFTWIGLGVSVAVLVGWASAAGMTVTVALAFFLVLGCFVLVYARIRAETGVPLEWTFPYGLPKETVVNAFSVPDLLSFGGGVRGMVILSSLAWLSRHPLGEQMAAYQVDGMKLAEHARIRRPVLITALLLAFVVGLAASSWAHLSGYSLFGSNASAGGAGEFRAAVALQEYQQMANRIATPPPRDWARLGATGAGFMVAVALANARLRWPGIQLHPLGYILATAYGDFTTSFFALFLAWLSKAVILKAGGLRLYRSAMPFFVGLIIGHFTVGGILWPIISRLLLPEAAASYYLHFGS